MIRKDFVDGAARATRAYFRALIDPHMILLILVAASGTAWIESLVEVVESWDRKEWSWALYLMIFFSLAISSGRRIFRTIREDQRKECRSTPGAARLMPMGAEIPKPMRAAWLKIALGPGGSGYADWVIAKSSPSDGHDQLMEYAKTWLHEWEPPQSNRDESVAWHEAGHAIAAQALGFTVLKATIVPWQNLAGRVEHCMPIPKIADHVVAWRRAVIALAGQAVDHERSVHDGGSTSDMEQAVTNARLVTSTGLHPPGYDGELNTDAILAAARDTARGIVRESRDLAEELAARLLAEKTLGNHAMRDILDRVPVWAPDKLAAATARETVPAGKA